MAKPIASALEAKAHIRVFDEIVESRIAAIDVSSLLVYLIDVVDASALDFLASQFDMLGVKGYGLASTETERRDVLKSAIELHRKKGTVFSIVDILGRAGYPNSFIIESIDYTYNSEFTYNSYIDHNQSIWASFAAYVNTNLETPSSANQTLINALIQEFKNARSLLRFIVYIAYIYDDAGVLIPGAIGVALDPSGEWYDIDNFEGTTFSEDTDNLTYGGVNYPVNIVEINFP